MVLIVTFSVAYNFIKFFELHIDTVKFEQYPEFSNGTEAPKIVKVIR